MKSARLYRPIASRSRTLSRWPRWVVKCHNASGQCDVKCVFAAPDLPSTAARPSTGASSHRLRNHRIHSSREFCLTYRFAAREAVLPDSSTGCGRGLQVGIGIRQSSDSLLEAGRRLRSGQVNRMDQPQLGTRWVAAATLYMAQACARAVAYDVTLHRPALFPCLPCEPSLQDILRCRGRMHCSSACVLAVRQ